MINSYRQGQVLLAVIAVAALVLGLMTFSLNSAYREQESLSNLIASEDIFTIIDSVLRDSLLRALRQPEMGNDSLTVLGASCTIEISTTATKEILVTCQKDGKYRRLQAEVNFNNGLMSVISIEEVE